VDKWITFGKKLYQQLDEVDVFGLAAQLAYFFLLSLFPFLLFLLNLVGYLPIDAQIIFGIISDFAPAQIMELISTNVSQMLNEQNGGLLSIGIIGTLWAASNGVNAIVKALNRAYDVEENRSFILSRLLAVALTIVMVFVLLIALLLPIFGNIIAEFFFSFFGLSEALLADIETFRWFFSSLIFFIALSALYKLGPNRKVYFRHVFVGAALSTFVWQLTSFGFSLYVEYIANYSVNYGSLGTIIILMIWFYLFGMIVILGGMVNATLMDMSKIHKKRR